VEQFYHKQDHAPFHISNPDASVWRVICQGTFDDLTSRDIMEIIQIRHIHITDMPSSTVSFDREGLRHLKSLDAVVKIEGKRSNLYKKLFLKFPHQINQRHMGKTVVL
jgi:hypothetical protein